MLKITTVSDVGALRKHLYRVFTMRFTVSNSFLLGVYNFTYYEPSLQYGLSTVYRSESAVTSERSHLPFYC
jgi:hypothetical protein